MRTENLYQNIRAVRQKNGLSQTDLASSLEVSRQTISNWEKGITVPDATALERLANLMHVSVTSLLGNPAINESEEDKKDTIQLSSVDYEPTQSQSIIAQQLARLNELYAEKIMRDEEQKETLKRYMHYTILLILIVALLFLLMPFVRFWYMSASKGETKPLQEETVFIEQR